MISFCCYDLITLVCVKDYLLTLDRYGYEASVKTSVSQLKFRYSERKRKDAHINQNDIVLF